MIAFEVALSGTKACTAGVGDEGMLTCILSYVASRRELELDVGGSVDGTHMNWAMPPLKVGDTVTIRIVETGLPDQPTTSEAEDPGLVEREERKYYERLRRKYEGG